MMKTGLFLSAVFYLSLLVGTSHAEIFTTNAAVWRNVTPGIGDPNLMTVAVSPDNSDIVYTGSSNAVYKTMNEGVIWNEVLTLRGERKAINFIAINPLNTDIAYAGTQNGLYKSADQGENWKRIFKGIGDLESNIFSVAINPLNPEIVFIGTGGGLFWTDDGGKRWYKDHKLPSEAVISSIAIDQSNPSIMYVGVENRLYKSVDMGNGWDRMFTMSAVEKEGQDTTDEITEEEIKVVQTEIENILINPSDTKTVYIGTSRGLFITQDAGLTWEIASTSGLTNRHIHYLAIDPKDPDGLYAATNRGVFRYSNAARNWRELYKGIDSTKSRFLAFDPVRYQTLWVTTEKGIFKATKGGAHAVRQNATSIGEEGVEIPTFDKEPSIQEIQEAAIRYAEVHSEKIEKWRKAAARKAWLPDLRVSYDKNKDWQSSGYFAYGEYIDDDITLDRDWSWSISLTWDFGDLIWSNDQTSIDTRSRLMVQLRDDVLNEVTRLYFERRRLQVEMFLSPPEDTSTMIEKEIRLQELTADIDALTNFYLSRSLADARH